MRTYFQKVEQIITIRDYLKTQLSTLSGFTKVVTTQAEMVNCTDFPFIVVLYLSGERETVREIGNDVLHYDIVLVDRQENELTVLDTCKTIAALFEDYQLNGNCIKCMPGCPQLYWDSIGGVQTVQVVIRLDIEI